LEIGFWHMQVDQKLGKKPKHKEIGYINSKKIGKKRKKE